MAIYDFNVTAAAVKEKVPLDTRSIPSASTPDTLDDTDITDWIDEGASELSGALRKAGVTGSDLDDEAESQIQRAVTHYAVAEVLSSLGHTGQSYEAARDKYRAALDRYTDSPSTLDRESGGVRSNVDTDKGHHSASDFTDTTYDY